MLSDNGLKEKKNQATLLLTVGIIAAFATLSFIGTTVIRIPIPATGGYFNLGDTFVYVSSLLYGPIVGFFVGLIGPTLSDALGFPQFIFATAVVKSLEGLIVGLIAIGNKGVFRVMISILFGVIVLVGGYFVFEAYIYYELGKTIPFFKVTDFNAAIAEILPNTLQGLFSGILSFTIWKIFSSKIQ